MQKPISAMLMLVRADASVENGTGHVMRCIALAQAFKAAGGRCIFVSSGLPIALASRLNDEGFDNIALASPPGSSEDANEFGALANKLNASWTAIDGYHFSNVYCQTVKHYGHRLIVIDDTPRVACDCADIVLSPNSGVDPSLCPAPHRPRLLTGLQYTLLRQEFWNGGKARRYPRIARRLLVSLGGSDPSNVTATILRCLAIATVEGGELFIVAGAINPHFGSLLGQPAAKQWKISLKRDVRNMAALLSWADLAIAAAGGTAWELAVMGVPSLLVPIAANQEPVARTLHQRRAAINLGPAAKLNSELIAETIDELRRNRARRIDLSSNAQQLVDGRGAHRVVERMREVETGVPVDPISIRNADPGDSGLLWAWANEPAVRAVSFSSDPIPWEEHERWMAQMLMDPACRLYIGINNECEAVGQVRFQIDDRSAKISVSLDARFRGKGYGVLLIRKAIHELFLTTPVVVIEAFVKVANDSSRRVFRKAGFTEVGEQPVQGQAAVRFILEKSVS